MPPKPAPRPSSGASAHTPDSLDVDKPIDGQNFVCLSFISPNKVLKNKERYIFQEFLKYYDFQVKFNMVEKYLRESDEAKRNTWNDLLKKYESNPEITELLKEAEVAAFSFPRDLEGFQKFVANNKRRWAETDVEEDFAKFRSKHSRDLETRFYEANKFRTSVQGVKVRGTFSTQGEAEAHAKRLHKNDKHFHVFVGQVGYWLPWDPEAEDVKDQQYAEPELNELVHQYKKNEEQREEFFQRMKEEKLRAAREGIANSSSETGKIVPLSTSIEPVTEDASSVPAVAVEAPSPAVSGSGNDVVPTEVKSDAEDFLNRVLVSNHTIPQ